MANRWVALVIVFVTRTSMGFQFQVVAAVAPLMVAELQLTWVQLGSLIGLYMLPGAVFALPGGVLGQRYGDRRIVVASLALMVAGGFVTAAAHGFVVAAAGRLVSGAGAVLMNILLAKMVADWFTGRELSTAMGIMLTRYPELFGALVCSVPLLDMRRFHLLLAGASWVAEYGDPDNPDDWEFMSKYSPYQNISPDRRYPPVLITTSTRDDRVHPGHARKMTAALESAGHPVQYYENIEGGHAGAADNAQSAFRAALIYEFLHRTLDE